MRLLTLTVATLAANAALACDCTKPANYGNPQCAAQITSALNAKAPTAAAPATASANASAAVGPVTATGGAQQQQQQQRQGQAQQATASSVGGTQATTIETNVAAPRIPVNTAYAAGLVAGLCGVGSTSAGVQTPIIGATFGSTRQNKPLRAVCTAYLISPLIGCTVAYQQLPEIKSAFDALMMTCSGLFEPQVEYRVPDGYLSPAEVEARVADAVRAVAPPPCEAPPPAPAKRKKRVAAPVPPAPSCMMPKL
jgi:hypothetical protein